MYKADILIDESLLTQDRKPEHEAGVKPRPIRKRGYHRAFKRQEPWALVKKAVKDMNKDSNNTFNDTRNSADFLGLRSFLESRTIKIPK